MNLFTNWFIFLFFDRNFNIGVNVSDILIIIGWLISAILSYVVGEKLHFTQRRKEKLEKFENAIQHYMLTATSMSNTDRYSNFTLKYITWKTNDRLNFLNTNNIIELSEFFDWMSKKFNDDGQQMSFHDFWKRQIQ